jgi:predicted Zn-dependent protease
MNQLASTNEYSDEEADAADSRADRMTADVLWMTSRLSVRRAALPWVFSPWAVAVAFHAMRGMYLHAERLLAKAG